MVPTTAPTRYEVAVYNPTTGARATLGFTARKSLYGVEAIACDAAAVAREFTGLAGNTSFTKVRTPYGRAYAFGDWRIGFTGRTEREIKNAPGAC